jgi:hypothetical protein
MSRPFEPVRRIVLSASLGVGAAAACSAAEAAWSRSSSGASPSPFLDALTVCFGLIAPLALAISLITGAMFAWLSPDEPPSFRSWIAKLRTLATGGRQADVAAFAPLAVIAAFLWMTSSAHLARSVLSLSVSSHLAGLAVMGSTLGLGSASRSRRSRAYPRCDAPSPS